MPRSRINATQKQEAKPRLAMCEEGPEVRNVMGAHQLANAEEVCRPTCAWCGASARSTGPRHEEASRTNLRCLHEPDLDQGKAIELI